MPSAAYNNGNNKNNNNNNIYNNINNNNNNNKDDDDENLVRIFLNLTLQIGHLDRLGWHSKHTMWPATNML